ncbi:hypothetical protein OZX56_05385 [Lactobacillus sp. ESL0684]|uniref:hypothetical protein n=1 Tax=Lactobacillus sp. ESL0684 TaxID=2983213 RepID=UPI0023F92ED9|nr:hypothetical protein [Lactobacillus sp. ESL0684]WEV42982.1 hypothetical protein OZX56_05385 [Lactobacillus sp. ESL0684]
MQNRKFEAFKDDSGDYFVIYNYKNKHNLPYAVDVINLSKGLVICSRIDKTTANYVCQGMQPVNLSVTLMEVPHDR